MQNNLETTGKKFTSLSQCQLKNKKKIEKAAHIGLQMIILTGHVVTATVKQCKLTE